MDDEKIDRYVDHRNASGKRGVGVEVEHPRLKKKKKMQRHEINVSQEGEVVCYA